MADSNTHSNQNPRPNRREREAENPGRPGGRRGNSRKSGRNRPRRFSGPEEVQVCPLCGQNVRDMLTAISLGSAGPAVSGEDDVSGDTGVSVGDGVSIGNVAHFDCVLKKIASEEEVKNKDKVCYLGKGEFGIIHFKGGSKFEIVKRISFEDPETAPEWRKNISRRLKK